MKIVNRFKDNKDGRLLVIYESKFGDLIGEVYQSGIRKAGKWDSRAKFTAMTKDCSEYRVREYFGFLGENIIEVS
jgi:hypothetical protein